MAQLKALVLQRRQLLPNQIQRTDHHFFWTQLASGLHNNQALLEPEASSVHTPTHLNGEDKLVFPHAHAHGRVVFRIVLERVRYLDALIAVHAAHGVVHSKLFATES